MTQEDIQKAEELEQEAKETRYLMAQNTDDLKAARADVAGFKLEVRGGKPGARLELDAATKRVTEIEERAGTLDERLLSITKEEGALKKWDMQARSIARENGLNESQMERLFAEFKAGKMHADVLRMAQNLKKAEGTGTAQTFAFEGANDVRW